MIKTLENTNRIYSLDSLRGLAALAVVFYHCVLCFSIFYDNYSDNEIIYNLLKIINFTPVHLFIAGRESVLLFFVLSGFVLSLPFLSGKKYRYKNYMVQRLCRIYIPYIFVMTLSAFLMILLSDYKPNTYYTEAFNHRWEHPVSIISILSYIFMIGYDVNNINGATWSLVQEMRVSFLFPLIMVFLVKMKWNKFFFVSFSAFSLLWIIFKGFAQMFYINEPINFMISSLGDTCFYTTFFIMGATIAKCTPQISKIVKKLRLTYKVTLLIISLSIINLKLLNNFSFGEDGIIYIITNAINQWVVGIGVSIIFSIVLNSQKLKNMLTRKTPLFLGRISYSVYLIHPVILILSGKYLSILVGPILAIVIVPFLTIPLAWIMHIYIENPSAKLGKILAKEKLNRNNEIKIAS